MLAGVILFLVSLALSDADAQALKVRPVRHTRGTAVDLDLQFRSNGDSTDVVAIAADSIVEWFVIYGNNTAAPGGSPLQVPDGWTGWLWANPYTPVNAALWPCGYPTVQFLDWFTLTGGGGGPYAPWTPATAVFRIAGRATTAGPPIAVQAAKFEDGQIVTANVRVTFDYEPCGVVAVARSAWSTVKTLYR